MQSSRKDLIVALSLIAGGMAVFFLYLFLMDHDPDERPLGLLDWMVGGALIGPGFGYLIKWRKGQGR